MAITSLLAFLGFSCFNDYDAPVAYGSPHATYKVLGIVVSETDNSPIEGIRAELKVDTSYNYAIVTAYTNSNGIFFLQGNEHGFTNRILYVELVDVNDGSFVSMEVEADFRDKTFTGSSGWYEGEALINLGKIPMQPNSESE